MVATWVGKTFGGKGEGGGGVEAGPATRHTHIEGVGGRARGAAWLRHALPRPHSGLALHLSLPRHQCRPPPRRRSWRAPCCCACLPRAPPPPFRPCAAAFRVGPSARPLPTMLLLRTRAPPGSRIALLCRPC